MQSWKTSNREATSEEANFLNKIVLDIVASLLQQLYAVIELSAQQDVPQMVLITN